ncbi:MAG TPA: DUF3016 domain-containing protein [Burkholderiaceae bacterium]
MKTLAKFLMAPALLLSAAGASAAVTVRFNDPANFADVASSPIERDRTLKSIEEHFAKLAAKLPAGQDLTVDVLDIDLAGRIEPVRSMTQDLRILRGMADWPHMKLRYTLTAGGQTVRSGEAQLANQAYLNRIVLYSTGDPLRYEKQMMDDWFYKEFKVSRMTRQAAR